jgi:hypothetical protein
METNLLPLTYCEADGNFHGVSGAVEIRTLVRSFVFPQELAK